MKFIIFKFSFLLLTLFPVAALNAQDAVSGGLDRLHSREFREALRLHDYGMYSRSRHAFDELSSKTVSADPRGYAVLNDVRMNVPGYQRGMESFFESDPHSVLIPKIRYVHALNLFDAQEYKRALAEFQLLKPSLLYKSQRPEYLFKRGYAFLESGDMDSAMNDFRQVAQMKESDYAAPSRYAIGYINYELKDFDEALRWFEQSVKDGRFSEMSSFYIMECRFMLGDHAFVTSNGDRMYKLVADERKPQMARIISESWLVLGNAENARKYLELNTLSGGQAKSRSDWFYRGSVLYAVQDYKGAIENFVMMGHLNDSIGQVAGYHLGYSYIQTKNKVAAMEAFKAASRLDFDADMAEDAFFNYAKLAFDLNTDTSVFSEYLKKYSELEKGDRIYSYMAVAALHGRDYEGAVNAYGEIDELDDDMRGNYMRANYLRAEQLISNGSYRKAIPCLKIAAYYSERGSRFNQLTRFWLAESYYRNDQYAEARGIYTDLYNTSALYGRPESYLITYNIAYTYFKEGNYALSRKWFSEYLTEKSVKYRKDALERKADCHFITKDYEGAAAAYDLVLKDYYDINDIYPYYQAALSYGLKGDSARKIELLAAVKDASPAAEFYPEALYELGRSYAVREDDGNAFGCFRMLADNVKDSTFVAKAYIEMGSLARNQSQYEEALGYYKKVVEEMPLSGYAEDALISIESIYQTRNEPEEYIAYIENIGKGTVKTADEKETMIFNAAEQIYLSENYQKALVSLQSYEEKYPDGRYLFKAHFYMAESYKNLGKLEQACDSYRKVISDGEGSFVELSMLNFANLSYRLERWDDAFGGYTSLYNSAKLENNTYVALSGMMRSSFKGHDWQQAVLNADRLLNDVRSDDVMKVEARYVKAKSFLATSRRDEAFAILEVLSKDVMNAYGAEAAYLIILDSYDKGEFENVESKVYAFADAGSDQTYWLAKSFIVLGDSFMERGETAQAKATFESVRDGYAPDGSGDDVADNVAMRLRKIEEITNQNTDETL